MQQQNVCIEGQGGGKGRKGAGEEGEAGKGGGSCTTLPMPSFCWFQVHLLLTEQQGNCDACVDLYLSRTDRQTDRQMNRRKMVARLNADAC